MKRRFTLNILIDPIDFSTWNPSGNRASYFSYLSMQVILTTKFNPDNITIQGSATCGLSLSLSYYYYIFSRDIISAKLESHEKRVPRKLNTRNFVTCTKTVISVFRLLPGVYIREEGFKFQFNLCPYSCNICDPYLKAKWQRKMLLPILFQMREIKVARK